MQFASGQSALSNDRTSFIHLCIGHSLQTFSLLCSRCLALTTARRGYAPCSLPGRLCLKKRVEDLSTFAASVERKSAAEVFALDRTRLIAPAGQLLLNNGHGLECVLINVFH